MSIKTVLIALFLLPFLAAAQTATDTTIYEVTDVMPFPMINSCMKNAKPDWTRDSIKRCADIQLLGLVSSNIRYPQEAREKNLQGTVVVVYVVEIDGKISNVSLLKDIGGGCGAEALRVMAALDEAGLRYMPGQIKDKPVRVKQTLPLRFRLQEAIPYYVNAAGDSVYTDIEAAAEFRGGMDSLAKFVINQLAYPAGYQDSCKTGVMEMSLIVRYDGAIKVENQLDFNNLGLDFQWEGLQLVKRTVGSWLPAQYGGRAVTSSLPLRVVFKADNPRCAAANARFDQAMILANAGVALLEQGKTEEAIAKWDAALAMEPNNTEFLYYRASAQLNANHRDAACTDYNRIKQLLGYTWFENIRRVVCGW